MPSEGDTSAEPGVATEAGTAESTSTEDATPTQQPADASSQGKKGAQLLPATGDAVAMAAIGAVLVTSGITVVLIRQKARRSS